MEHHIFRKKSLEQISSPEELDQYLRVTRPVSWLLPAALLLAAAAAAFWGFAGHIYTTVSGAGIRTGEEMVCFFSVNEAFDVKPGMKIFIEADGMENTITGKVLRIGEALTSAEAAEYAKAGWLEEELPAWVCPVWMETQEEERRLPAEGRSFAAEAVLREQRPVDLLTGRNE